MLKTSELVAISRKSGRLQKQVEEQRCIVLNCYRKDKTCRKTTFS